MPALEAIDLHKTFKATRAVRGVSLRVERGETVGLLGPNGAGKTTTLMMLLGATEPDAGSVSVLGHRLPGGRATAMRRVGFTATYAGLPHTLRVREFLDVFADIQRAPRRRIGEVVELLGVSALVPQACHELSSGQRTMVGLAKALLNEPELLVLDEPTASLDPDVAERLRTVIRHEHARTGLSLVITSHNMADIERLCGRVVFIAAGRVVADGPPAEIARRYGHDDLERTFISIAEEARV